MKRWLLCPREVAAWRREGFLEENERNKPMEGKLVLCWTAIKKEKMVIKYIMENVEHTQGMVITVDKLVFY